MDAAVDNHCLAAVVGAAGTGKTTLLASWLGARRNRPAAWLACDDSDRDPARFVAALVESLRRGFGAPDVGASALELLDLDGEVSTDVLAALADDLEEMPFDCVLVVDDFHLAAGPSDAVLATFVDHRPLQLSVVIASRSDVRLRRHDASTPEHVVQLRGDDLSFSLEETRGFIEAYGLELVERDVEVLHGRTEGWPAGVQMAVLSIAASTDAVASTTRVDVQSHAVASYFLEEVLYRQPPAVVEFMLRTAVLDELSVPACAAMGGEGAADLLDQLCSSHLFVTPVDGEARTYRYHQLVKEVLLEELRRRDPSLNAALHELAAGYLIDAGHAGSAARHLLEAGDPTTAFQLLSDRIASDVLTHPTTASALDVDEFRPEVFKGVPEILVPLAAALLWHGSFDRGARAALLARECVIDPSRQPEFTLRMAVVNTLLHTFVGEFSDALRQREVARPLEAAVPGARDWVVTLEAIEMFCHAHLGHFREARKVGEAITDSGASVPLSLAGVPGVLSQAAVLEGHIDEAAMLAERSLAAAHALHFDDHYFAFYGLRTRAQVALERRDLRAAEAAVERALAVVSGARPLLNFQAQLDRAKIWAAGGDREAALASIPAARVALKSQVSNARHDADELEARLRLDLGDPRGAQKLASRLPSARRSVMEAIIALVAGNPAAAERALGGAPEIAPTARLDAELQLLHANVALASRREDATRRVRQALDAARGCGFVQTVLDTAPALVDHVVANRDLYQDCDAAGPLIAARLGMHEAAGPTRTAPVGSLTEAEIKVLEKLAEHLSYAEIASELYLSLNTVKTHLRHAYTKLDVKSRSSAIARASTLGLV